MQVAKNLQALSLKITMLHAQVYDQSLDAALRAQACGPRRGTCNAGCQKFAGFVTQKTMLHAQVYDLSLDAALRAQACGPRQLTVEGEWAWLLGAFAGTYGVRPSYAGLAHLRWVVRCAPRMLSGSSGSPMLSHLRMEWSTHTAMPVMCAAKVASAVG